MMGQSQSRILFIPNLVDFFSIKLDWTTPGAPTATRY